MSTSQQPEGRFQVGTVSASVFVNEHTRSDGSTFQVRNTVLQRTYTKDDGTYGTTTSFGINDLPKAVLALVRAYAHCLNGPSKGNESNE